MINEFFKFPVVLIDGDHEEKKIKNKEKFGDLPNEEEDEEYDVIQGFAEYPYWDFIGIEDRWIPCTESFKRAMKGKFDACIVRFLNVGQLLVPWTREKFKDEIKKFEQEYLTMNPTKKEQELRVLNITPEQLEKIMKDEK